MSEQKALQFLREGYGDTSFVAVKEWQGPNGTIGVYHSEAYGYWYLFVLVDAEKRIYYQQQYIPAMPQSTVMKDAEILAAFAGAQEKERGEQ